MTEQKKEQVIVGDASKTPKSVKFIVCSVFLERFSTGGITGEGFVIKT